MHVRYCRLPVFVLLIVLLMPTVSWSEEVITMGRTIYERDCQVCHGTNGMGSELDWTKPLGGPGLRYPPPPLDHSAHAWHHPDDVLKGMILKGGEDGRMPPFRGKLSAKDIGAVIRFMHSLWKPDQLKWQQEISQNSPRQP